MSDSLERLNIYNLGRFDGSGKNVLLYAPLSCNCAVVCPEELDRLESVARGESQDTEYVGFLGEMTAHAPVRRITRLSDFVNLSLLPTNACNFACSYCYSAKGRSSGTIDLPTVKNMIRWFADLHRDAIKNLHITVFGGGEPMLCWDTIVRPAIEFIGDIRRNYLAGIRITLITNGSILPPDFIDVCRRDNIDLAISFEILREIQDLQRRNHDRVADNIRRLTEAGIPPAINSVITDASVNLMPEMVKSVIENFPGVRYLSFEPVTGIHTMEFHDDFISFFFEARSIAEKSGINLTTSALRNVDVSVERYCAGELALTSTGDITICPCVSAPHQPGYDRWIYGHADSQKVDIDMDRLQRMLGHDVNSQTWCDKCFARYNCGGGCVNKTEDLGGKPDRNYCSFFRDFLRRVLIERARY